MNEGLEVRKSNIDGGGWGVFTTKAFKKDDLLTTYDGYKLPYFELHMGDEISSSLDMDEDVYIVCTHQDYILEPSEDECIYGYKKQYIDKHKNVGLGSLINDKFSINEWKDEAVEKYVEDRGGRSNINCSIYNCLITKDKEIKATRDIEEGEELYTHYGQDFWLKKLNDDRYNEGFKYVSAQMDKNS